MWHEQLSRRREESSLNLSPLTRLKGLHSETAAFKGVPLPSSPKYLQDCTISLSTIAGMVAADLEVTSFSAYKF